MKKTSDKNLEKTSANLEKWALIAEVIGGIAIVVTLGIVAFELHQSTEQAKLNTSALEIASYQDLIQNISDLNEVALSNPEIMVAIRKSLSNPETLTENERNAAGFYYMSLFRHGDMAFFQYQRGAINQQRLNSALRIVTGRLQAPYVRNFWHSRKVVFVTEYQEYLDALIESNAFLEPEF